MNDLLGGMSQFSVISSQPHTRYLFASLVYLRHDLVFDNGLLNVDGKVSDLKARLHFKTGFLRGGVRVTPKVCGINLDCFVS